MSQIIDKLMKAIRDAAVYNPDVQAAPACILWPDRDRQWEAVIPRLQNEMRELFILEEYDPAKRTGPAIWLRCVIARKIGEDVSLSAVSLPKDHTPILYLPGISRQDLRAVESCPDQLKPLVELQYRGVIWTQNNARDWTIMAFLKSSQGGLGLDVAQDNGTKNAMQLALYRLLDEEIDLLKGKRLDKDYFNTLLTGGDPVRDLLQWLDQGDAFRAGRGENEWRAFVEVCKSQLAFDPENDGILAGAAKLAGHEGPWHPVWERFCEAPRRYPDIPNQIRKCSAPKPTVFHNTNTYGGWPQWNEREETSLRNDLRTLSSLPPHEARKRISELEEWHCDRRALVWADLGESPLALALEWLAALAETTITALCAGTAEEMAAGYGNFGWLADDSVVRALACVDKQEDWEVVCTAIRAVYLPWLEESARYLQKVVAQTGYPGGFVSPLETLSRANQPDLAGWPDRTGSKYNLVVDDVHRTERADRTNRTDRPDGECILFVDGLRFDTARRLAEVLTGHGCQVEERAVWAALPSVTATGKPAVTPIRDKIRGQEVNANFEPCVADTGQSLKGGYHLKKLLADAGWEVLERSSNGSGRVSGSAWCEFGDIDHEGHDRGWKLAKHLDSMLTEIHDRVEQLITAGCKTVRIVTDHGWLLLPGGLPKIDLPGSLTENKWGRCAAIKPGAMTDERLYPWYWNQNLSFALADGISCYRNGEEYAHGGLSLQECLTLELTVSSPSGASSASTSSKGIVSAEFTDIVWKGLRCTVAVAGEFSESSGKFSSLSLDVRTQPGNPSTSVVVGVKPLKDNGTASVVVENEELQGASATIVLLDSEGGLVAQIATVIGESGH